MATEKPRILFVDDETKILEALGRSLREKRHDWNMAFIDSAEAALREARNPHADVLVTDLAMPGMSGLELVRGMNETSPETKCIILTGTGDLQTAAEIINTVRVFRFYTKPCETGVLVDGIVAALVDGASSSISEPTSQFGFGPGPGNIVLDKLSTGVLLVTRKGEVVYMNQSAAEIVAAADSLSIGHDQILRASTSEETGRLREACVHLGGTSNDSDIVALSVERPSMREALKLIFAPLENSQQDPEGNVIIFIADPEKNALPTAEIIARFFGLTPTESRLARVLIGGQRTEEIAVSMGITISSARTYLKRIMEKTGTNRQVDLVRLLLSTPQIICQPQEDTRPR